MHTTLKKQGPKNSRKNKAKRQVWDVDYELVTAVPWGKTRSVLVFRQEFGGRMWVRLRTFNKHTTKGVWYPSPRFFVVPMANAEALGKAILDAANGVQGDIPDWYEEFEKQYETRQTG